MRLATCFAAPIALAALAVPALGADAVGPFGGHAPQSGGLTSGGYVALRGGITAIQETEFEPASLGVTRVDNEYEDIGGFVSAAAGAAFGATRLEADVTYLRGSIKDHIASVAGVSTRFDADESLGDIDVVTVMANVYYDLDLGFLKPFVGGGIGVGFVSANDYGVTPLAASTPGGVLLDDNDMGLAYQLTAGLAFDVGRATAEVGYRYLGMEAELETLAGAESDFDVNTHNGFVGVRFDF